MRAATSHNVSGFGPSAKEEAADICNHLLEKDAKKGWSTDQEVSCSPLSFCYKHCVKNAKSEGQGC